MIGAPSASGPTLLCIRVPAPGRSALFVLHDRDGDGRFGVLRDGAGFAGNPRIGMSEALRRLGEHHRGQRRGDHLDHPELSPGLGFSPLDRGS